MANNTTELKKFAQAARRQLREQVAGRMEEVLRVDSAYLRERDTAVKELQRQIALSSKQAVVDKVAYTWFNRFCALRFMDVNRYNRIGIVSPAEGFTQPEILQEAKQGYIDEDLKPFIDLQLVFNLLRGQNPSRDPQQEAYRLLLVGVCNSYNEAMPFLFEKIADYTELLMPIDLLSENSVLESLRQALTVEACQDVEVIGWLYQYYISERKDEVFANVKKGVKIEAEDIPAVTQLFTPHWIVRYLVENSLGRLWLLNRPNSRLAKRMEYYIKPVDEETDYLNLTSPEEIKLCDPACGSGHMLTYAFDLLYAIYEEEGYSHTDIPRLILEKNLFGIEIDERAGALAAFALMMKARGKDKRFFSRGAMPRVCVLENVEFTEGELKDYMDAVGRDLFTVPLRQTLQQFEQAKNFGSLIIPEVSNIHFIRQELARKDLAGNLFLYGIHQRVLRVLEMAEYLSPRYKVVVANPPYMNSSGMNEDLKEFLQDFYKDFKSDLFSAFIIRNHKLCLNMGQLGFMAPFVWMFISSYEKLREFLISQKTITSLIQLEYSGFEGATVPICTFTLENSFKPGFKGSFIRLSDFRGSDNQAPKTLEAIQNPNCGWFYRASAADFKKIPGSPIAYWVSEELINTFVENHPLSDYADTRIGLITGDNEDYLRFWYEVTYKKIGFSYDRKYARESQTKWFPISKGGDFRKWYGNNLVIINWENDGYLLQNRMHSSGDRLLAHNFNLDKIFDRSITWTKISSGSFSARLQPKGFLFNDASANAFPIDEKHTFPIIGFMCSRLAQQILQIMNPTLNYLPGNISSLPLPDTILTNSVICMNSERAVSIAKSDWDTCELSWDFSFNPILENSLGNILISEKFSNFYENCIKYVDELKILEEENNKEVYSAFGLLLDNNFGVKTENITLLNNPFYRYSLNDKESCFIAFRSDTCSDLLSYSVGCMFGRYSLDKPGLILANQGDTSREYLKQIPEPSFTPDEDNVIPVLDGDWFKDDIAERFKQFLKVSFGEEHYEENLAFVEEAIGRDIRGYFLKDFYPNHLKMYKKRPIYWLFSSPNGTFNALIYMHRFNKDTVSVILNKYLREFRAKLEARKNYLEKVSVSGSATQSEKVSALKEIEKLKKTLDEIWTYEKEILYPLATQQIEIDLDDGVKVNYLKFGKALAKIPGLEKKED